MEKSFNFTVTEIGHIHYRTAHSQWNFVDLVNPDHYIIAYAESGSCHYLLDGKDVLERILEDFPEDSIDFTLDLGWAGFAHDGNDQAVIDLIRTLKGRLSRIHLKDFADKPEHIDTIAYLRPIFEGKLDYDAYIPELKAAGTEYMLVEQDWSYEEDEFECLRRSYVNVKQHFPEVE